MKDEIMKQPLEPSKEDCCNSGCNPCIFDVYDKQLKLYKKCLEGGKLSGQPADNAISQLEYTSFIVVQCIELCESHKILAFKSLVEGNTKIWWKPGDHLLFKYNSNKISCTRAYTPMKLSNIINTEDYDFSIVVKVYKNGLVSRHLYDLKLGEQSLWRGPYGSYELIPNQFQRIIMIAQGTGIAPFKSIIDNILNNEDEMTKVLLYYCCQDEETILLRDELYSLKSYWNFTYKVFLKRIVQEKHKYREPVVNHKLSIEDINEMKPFSPKDQFLLCGSSEFMQEYDLLLKQDNQVKCVIKF